MAARRGDMVAAEARFRQALAQEPRDSYLLGAYSDFLLDQKKPLDVLRLVKDQQRIDALLLRQALAWQMVPGQEAALQAATAELAARFNAAMRRGDTVHQREQARFALWLQRDIPGALRLAQSNWAIQKEAADMRILLEAAVAARDRAAAKPVLDWIAAHQVEDVALKALAQKAGAL